jgi:ADP-ribose diphosphatase
MISIMSTKPLTPEMYNIIESRTLLDHPLVQMVVDILEYSGQRRPYFYLNSPMDAVATVAVTADNQLVLTRQYRHPIRKVIFDLPAGRLSTGEDPLRGAARELEEETGYRAGRLIPLGQYSPFPGSLNVRAHLLFATDLIQVGQHLDEGEELEVVLKPIAEVLDLILRGECIDGSLQLGVLLAHQKGLVSTQSG